MKRRDFIGRVAILGAAAFGAVSNLNANSNLNNEKSADLASATNKGNAMKNQVWFITAATGGFGYELAKYALSKGDCVVATSRTLAKTRRNSAKKASDFCLWS